MTARFTGRVEGDHYVVRAPDGGVVKMTPIAEARECPRHKAAIRRNGWESIDG